MHPDLYHAHHNRYLEDLPFWLELVAQTGDPVLEMGCGTGRVLIPLAEAGYHTTGLDHDLSMLKFIHTKITRGIQRAPLLIAADICDFNLNTQFPLIVLPCNTFNTLPETKRLACLRCVRGHLEPGGLFAVSMPNPDRLKRLPARSVEEFEDEFYHPQTGNPVQVSSTWHRTKRTFTVTWIYDQLFPDGRVERLLVESIHQTASTDTYLAEIESAGFMVTHVYGDFDHSAYTTSSPHLIILVSH